MVWRVLAPHQETLSKSRPRSGSPPTPDQRSRVASTVRDTPDRGGRWRGRTHGVAQPGHAVLAVRRV